MEPLEAYRARREYWQAQYDRLQRHFVTIGNYRLAIACVAGLLAWLAIARGLVSSWWLLAPVSVFFTLVIWHQRILRRRTLAQRALAFYDAGMNRIADKWMGRGNKGDRFRNPEHLYADDLDVFGSGSLFEMVATVRTATGEETLANWMLSPATMDVALSRQKSAIELSGRLDLREDLALLGEDIGSQVNVSSLESWGSAPPVHFAKELRILAPVLGAAAVATLVAFFAGYLPVWPFLVILSCNVLLMFRLRHRVASVFGASVTKGRDLAVLSVLIERLEREQFESVGLTQLRIRLETLARPASQRIAELQRRLEWLESTEHWLVRLIRPITLCNEQLAMTVEAWRQRTGPLIGDWIRALGEFEALSALGTLSFERPDWTFPTLTDSGKPALQAEALRHPLIPSGMCVPNDVGLGPERLLLIVSGSNMSGKSTLLRAIGLNAALAWAGAPVRCRKLALGRFHIGASIRVTDSLQDNRSRFFSEIQRIRQIIDLTKLDGHALFLLDELLSGTNSHDRLIGASGIIRGLLKEGAIGLITTHDLALTDLVQELGSRAANVHFEDQLNDGHLYFDYRLREGIVTHSNALELMRAVGLDV